MGAAVADVVSDSGQGLAKGGSFAVASEVSSASALSVERHQINIQYYYCYYYYFTGLLPRFLVEQENMSIPERPQPRI